jgi:hypothetical protein
MHIGAMKVDESAHIKMQILRPIKMYKINEVHEKTKKHPKSLNQWFSNYVPRHTGVP